MVTVMEGVHVTVRAAYKVNNEASNGEFRQTISRIWTIRLG